MKTKEELKNYLLENYVDEFGDLILSGLDFSDFDGDVFIDNMRVKGDLSQSEHIVQGDLFQHRHKVQGDLFQGDQKVQGNYYCSDVEVKGSIFANEPTRLLLVS